MLKATLFCLTLATTLIREGQGRDPKVALIIIDVQDCFVAGGGLAVTGANDIIPVINKIRSDFKDDFSLVVLSQDWHVPGHVSFASAHPGAPNLLNLTYSSDGDLCVDGRTITKQTFPRAIQCANQTRPTVPLTQALWPDHCVQNVNSGPTSSALVKGLLVHQDDLIIQKGIHREIDSYSAFFDNGGFGKTKLDEELKQRGITHVFVTGLAGDYCVYYTSLDAKKLGYDTYYVSDATRSVFDVTRKAAWEDLTKKGVQLTTSGQLSSVFKDIHTNSASLLLTWPPFLLVLMAYSSQQFLI